MIVTPVSDTHLDVYKRQVTQSPLMMGYYAIYALTAAANGQELEDVPTDGYWYDSTNMDSEEIAPNLYD